MNLVKALLPLKLKRNWNCNENFEYMGDVMEFATYQIIPEQNGNGTYFFTDCGHWMFSIRDQMAYHGCLCPGCLYNGQSTTLYIRGSEEANKHISKTGILCSEV